MKRLPLLFGYHLAYGWARRPGVLMSARFLAALMRIGYYRIGPVVFKLGGAKCIGP